MSKQEISTDIAKRLNDNVFKVISSDGLIGFEKAYLIANAASELKNLLTPEYMKPIMALQGNKLGFRTDKDKDGGYSEQVVKNCLIEAVLMGVQPFGNQFNIIAGNCYITKEGFGHLLANFKGLTYEIIPSLPRINADKSSAAIVVKIRWTLKGETKEREIDIPVKMNSMMGTDAVIGKATRKARAWLYNTINGVCEIADGDATEYAKAEVVGTKINREAKEEERLTLMIKDAKSTEQLKELIKDASLTADQIELVLQKEEELNGR